MNMVMTHEFEHAFLNKMKKKQLLERELEEIAARQQRNAKYNIYMTKAQALRNEVTKNNIEFNQLKDLEELLLTAQRSA